MAGSILCFSLLGHCLRLFWTGRLPLLKRVRILLLISISRQISPCKKRNLFSYGYTAFPSKKYFFGLKPYLVRLFGKDGTDKVL
jgi:hypothetical protein